MDFRNRSKVRIRHLIRTFQRWSKALGFRMLTALASFIGIRFRRCLGSVYHRGSFPPRSGITPVAKIARCGAPRRALSWQVDASIDR